MPAVMTAQPQAMAAMPGAAQLTGAARRRKQAAGREAG
jgi:hypothetical protein